MIAAEPSGRLAIAAHEMAQATSTRPPRRTATAKADVVGAPEAR